MQLMFLLRGNPKPFIYRMPHHIADLRLVELFPCAISKPTSAVSPDKWFWSLASPNHQRVGIENA